MNHSTTTDTNLNKCKQCGRILTKDEVALHKKLYNRGASSSYNVKP